MAAVMPARVVESERTSEAAWRDCPALGATPCVPLDQWLDKDCRLVIVAPHPGDEIIACGALLHMHAQAGGSVLIVAVTDGEGSHPGSSVWNPTALAEARETERREGLAHLLSRAPEVVKLGLPDGDIRAHADRLVGELVALLQPSDVVLTTWRRDGQPDHDATGAACAKACATMGNRLVEAPICMWHWAQPGDARVPWRKLRGLSVSPEASSHRRSAIAAHVTQLVPRDTGEGPALDDSTLARLDREVEYFFV